MKICWFVEMLFIMKSTSTTLTVDNSKPFLSTTYQNEWAAEIKADFVTLSISVYGVYLYQTMNP